MYFAENWDVRDGNLKKQQHLLSKSELKRRGITRYDAEILLAQGINLPEPKVDLGQKIPAIVREDQPIKITDLRLSPRKHLSSQSYLSMVNNIPVTKRKRSSEKLFNSLDSMKYPQSRPVSSSVKTPVPITSNVSATQGYKTIGLRRQQKGRKQLKANKALKIDVDSASMAYKGQTESQNHGVITYRHSPRLKNKNSADQTYVKKLDVGNDNLDISSGSDDPEITFKIHDNQEDRNIFTQLQFDVDELKNGKKVKTENGILAEQGDCLQSGHNEMPFLVPFDVDPLSGSLCKDTLVSPKLKSCDQDNTGQITENSCQIVEQGCPFRRNKQSKLSKISSPLRHSPRTRKRVKEETENSTDHPDVIQCSCKNTRTSHNCHNTSSHHSTCKQCVNDKVEKCTICCQEDTLSDNTDSVNSRTTSGCTVNSGGFEKFAAGDFSVEDSSVDVDTLGNSRDSKNRLSFENLRSTPRGNGGRKRKLSFDDSRLSEFGKPASQKILELTEDIKQCRRLFASISPGKKVPKITIKMRKDPVLIKELENQKSDSVQFKLESPNTSVPVTPDTSDNSDSDEEESPLNCTKFRLNLPNTTKDYRPKNKPRKLFPANRNGEHATCPKLMRIKLGNKSIIDINIPQQNDATRT